MEWGCYFMKIKKLFIILFLIFIIISIISCSNNTSDSTEENTGGFDEIDQEQQEELDYLSSDQLDDLVKSSREALSQEYNVSIPSLNILVETSQGIWYSNNSATGISDYTYQDSFRINEVTQMFTASAILKMDQDNWLDINATLTETIPGYTLDYIPNSSNWDLPNVEEITIKQLLQHSSGIFDIINQSRGAYNNKSYSDFMINDDFSHIFSTTEMISEISNNNLTYSEANSNFKINGTNYIILSEIISRIYSAHTGELKTYQNYLEEQLFNEIATSENFILFPYTFDDSKLFLPIMDGKYYDGNLNDVSEEVNLTNIVGFKNGIACSESLNIYLRALLCDDKIINDEYVDLMKNEKFVGSDFGLGIDYVRGLGYGNSGSGYGYTVVARYDPETDVSIIIVSNISFDDTETNDSFISSLNNIGIDAKEVLGYKTLDDE
jgi:D-alanyl-D-alanine carboxypeptidase